MNKKVFLDTNILLDAAMSERPDWAYAVMLLDEIAYGHIDGMIAATSLKDCYYILCKYAGESPARDFVRACLDLFEVCELDAATCRMAVNSNEPDFEDGLIRACAERENATFVISRDEKAYRRSAIKRLSARDYVELFCERDEVEV